MNKRLIRLSRAQAARGAAEEKKEKKDIKLLAAYKYPFMHYPTEVCDLAAARKGMERVEIVVSDDVAAYIKHRLPNTPIGVFVRFAMMEDDCVLPSLYVKKEPVEVAIAWWWWSQKTSDHDRLTAYELISSYKLNRRSPEVLEAAAFLGLTYYITEEPYYTWA